MQTTLIPADLDPDEQNVLVAEKPFEAISSTKTLARNISWSLAGRAAPMLVALFLTPTLIHQLGTVRWGIFTLALSLIGAFGIFDFGIGRALTRNVADAIGAGDMPAIASQIKTSLGALLLLGIVGSCTFALLVDHWLQRSLKVPPDYFAETKLSLYILCCAAPLVILDAGLSGIISAHQRAKSAQSFSIPLMILYYVGPAAISHNHHSLVPVMLFMVALRIVWTYSYWRLCVKIVPALIAAPFEPKSLIPVFKLSGWMTLSNFIWPVISYVDRFAIGSLISAEDVGYYSTPGDLLNRANVIPNTITNTAFPAIVACRSAAPLRACDIIRRSVITITSLLFPVALVIAVAGNLLFAKWVGAEFALHLRQLLPWFSLGLILSACGALTTSVLDALGLPRLNTIFSFCELLVYLPILFACVKVFGLQGAAISWFLRTSADFFVRLAIIAKVYPPIRRHLLAIAAPPTIAVLTAALCYSATTPVARAFWSLGAVTVYIAFVYRLSITKFERHQMKEKVVTALVSVVRKIFAASVESSTT